MLMASVMALKRDVYSLDSIKVLPFKVLCRHNNTKELKRMSKVVEPKNFYEDSRNAILTIDNSRLLC